MQVGSSAQRDRPVFLYAAVYDEIAEAEADSQGSAAVIVLGESKIEEQLERATKRANKLIEKQLDADADEFEREIKAAKEEGAAT